jgi:hypothetical protein
MKIKIFIWLFLIILFGCERDQAKRDQNIDIRKPLSWGSKQDIYVFADDNVWKYAEYHLRNTLERFVFTTVNEPVFQVKRANIQNIDTFYKFNNLLFLADMNSNQPVSAYIKGIMGNAAREEIAQNGIAIFPQQNLWARDQFVLILLAENERKLLELNIEMANQTYDLFQQKLYSRIRDQVYKTRIYDDSFFELMNWKMRLPKSYIVYKYDLSENFVSFLARLKDNPDRYISLYWEKMESAEDINQWLKAKRADLAWRYYDEDEFADRDIRIMRYKLGDYSGWKLAGRWQNKKYAVGGAFQSFAFYDESSKTAYLIDNSVYYPEGNKLMALIETEVISETFELKSILE